MKDKKFGDVVIHGTHEHTRYSLVLLTAECENDPKIISLLSMWRKTYARWFPSQFPVSDERTKIWFRKKYLDAPYRLLFMVQISDTYIGHVGLDRKNTNKKIYEIDNIIRGREGYSGIMEAAIQTMMQWGRRTLHIGGYALSTSSNNRKALALYKRLGFVETKRIPMVYKKSSEGGEWIPAPKNYHKSIFRQTVKMKLKISKIKPSKKKISFAGPSITKKEERYVVDAARNGFYETFDKHIKKLEVACSSYVGTHYALAGFCATHAMHLASLVCGFTKGDEVIVTDFSWAATAHVIAYTGAIPVFVDVDPSTWCIDPVAIERAITKKTKGIMLVHSFGIPADMDAIMKIAKKYKLKVIEDAAPALGSLYKGKKVGGIGDVGCISFHGAKIAVSGEGGMFLTNNKKMHEKAILLSNMGRTNRLANFWCDEMGYEYQMANVTAALALAQVERIEELVSMKRKIFGWYEERLSDFAPIQLIKEKEGMRSNYAYPAALLLNKKITRDAVVAKLKSYNIHAREAFPRMSRFPMYTARFKNPVATEVATWGFNLPSAFNLTEGDIDFVCTVLKKILS